MSLPPRRVEQVVPGIVGLAADADNRFDLDVSPADLDHERPVHSLPLNGQLDLRARLANDPGDSFGQRQVPG